MTMVAAVRKRGRPRKMGDGGHRHRSPASPSPATEAPRRTLRQRRRRPLSDGFADFDDYLDEEEEVEVEEEEEEDLERKGKRRQLKLILKLPPAPTTARRMEDEEEERKPRRVSHPARKSPYSSSATSSSHVDDDDEEEGEGDEEPIKPLKKRRYEGIDAGVRSTGSAPRETGEKNLLRRSKGPVSVYDSGVPTSSQPARTPLPERKILEAILDKIQKKDTYGVFANPVDIDELPDYLDVIEHPMDLGTVRKKLARNAYRSFEQFEDDVFLICSNAMQYNAPDTVYFRQARAMQDIGRKEFQMLRTEVKSIGTDSKSKEKIRINPTEKKPMQKCLPKVVQESFVSDISSATTLVSGGDIGTGLSTVEASGADPASTSNGLADNSSSLGDSKSEKVDDPRVKGSPSKLGKTSLDVDENRRATYNINYDQECEADTVFDVFEGEQRQLIAVGIDAEYSYARSLARFAGNLGPAAWKIASDRIANALPSGVKYGFGWVDEYEPPLSPILSISNSSKLQQKQTNLNSTVQFKMPLKKDKVTAVGKKTSGNGNLKEVDYGIQNQIRTSSHNRDYDLVKEGNELPRITGTKKQSRNDVSVTQQRTDAAVSQKNKQVAFNFANTSATASEQAGECQPSSSNTRFTNQALQGSHIYDSVVPSRPPATGQLDRKTGRLETLKQMESSVAPSNKTNGKVTARQFSSGKVSTSSCNSLDNTMKFLPENQKGIIVNHPPALGVYDQVHSDASGVMGLPFKMFSQPNLSSSFDSSKTFPSVVPPSCREKTIVPDYVAAQMWMPAGASLQSKPPQHIVDARNSSNGSVSTFSYGSWRTPSSSPRISDNSMTISMSQAFRQPIQVAGLEPQVRDKGLVIFPQLITNDMSRFQNQSPRQVPVPRMENKHNKDTFPPDLNISFQPPGSPVLHSPRILKDSQQPDLALQL
ncbi:uncharacterized protein LOC122017078 isoform X1 [Zingiber officinale]|uniref:Bromo domain-containing protein n=1 Tax=Zingiber officinale TaxID=94328 RepID=A0A8J5KMJ1_ZINOF|nr:uncharacterized protein LOC122017078 isoform X1 [Zingiber officinale]KAG6484307.1 hypothetical protein ZIOFF_061109 [Zingiber officinale]